MEPLSYKKHVWAVFAAFLMVLALGAYPAVKNAMEAQAGTLSTACASVACRLRGAAWSDNIGWVSFSNLDANTTPAYGVYSDGSGYLSGQAWSENVGWLSFDRSYTGNPPSNDIISSPTPTSPIAQLSGNTLVGWARFMNACGNVVCTSAAQNVGGWDGWVSFNDFSGGNKYGVAFNGTTGNIGDGTSAGWGSETVGWLAFTTSNQVYVDIGRVLTYTAGTGGTISGTSPQVVANGGSGSLVTAVPNSGYHFVQWSDNGSTNPSRTDNPVTTDISATATFAADAVSAVTASGSSNSTASITFLADRPETSNSVTASFTMNPPSTPLTFDGTSITTSANFPSGVIVSTPFTQSTTSTGVDVRMNFKLCSSLGCSTPSGHVINTGSYTVTVAGKYMDGATQKTVSVDIPLKVTNLIPKVNEQ
jgi:hypothetical protein